MKQITGKGRNKSEEKYHTPIAEVITVNSQNVLCESEQSFGLGNDSFTSGDSENPWD